MKTYQSCRLRASAMHRLQDPLHLLRRTSSHYRRSFALSGYHYELGRTRSVGMRPGCCSHLVRNHIHPVVVEHRSYPAAARSQVQGIGKSVRRCVGSRRPSGFRAHPTQHTMVGRPVVVVESVVEVDIESNLAAAVGVGIGSSLTAAVAAVAAYHHR